MRVQASSLTSTIHPLARKDRTTKSGVEALSIHFRYIPSYFSLENSRGRKKEKREKKGKRERKTALEYMIMSLTFSEETKEMLTVVLVEVMYNIFCVEGGSYHQLLFAGEYHGHLGMDGRCCLNPHLHSLLIGGTFPFFGAQVVACLSRQVWLLLLA